MTRADSHARTYTAEERAEAVALAASIGPLKAGDALGIPRRTVAYWTHQPAAGPIIAAAEATIAERLKDAHARALASVMEGLADPHSKLGDRATALRVLGEQLALAEGRATSRIESTNLNVNAETGLTDPETMQLRAWLESMQERHPDLFPPEIIEGEAFRG